MLFDNLEEDLRVGLRGQSFAASLWLHVMLAIWLACAGMLVFETDIGDQRRAFCEQDEVNWIATPKDGPLRYYSQAQASKRTPAQSIDADLSSEAVPGTAAGERNGFGGETSAQKDSRQHYFSDPVVASAPTMNFKVEPSPGFFRRAGTRIKKALDTSWDRTVRRLTDRGVSWEVDREWRQKEEDWRRYIRTPCGAFRPPRHIKWDNLFALIFLSAGMSTSFYLIKRALFA